MSVPAPAQPVPDHNWSRRIVVGICPVVALTLLALLGAAFLPRWWAQRIGDQVDGSITTGGFLGLFYGFVFTLLPLVVLWLAFHFLHTWRKRAVALDSGLARCTQLPDARHVLGTGNGAHAGDRILDVEAPAFAAGRSEARCSRPPASAGVVPARVETPRAASRRCARGVAGAYAERRRDALDLAAVGARRLAGSTSVTAIVHHRRGSSSRALAQLADALVRERDEYIQARLGQDLDLVERAESPDDEPK